MNRQIYDVYGNTKEYVNKQEYKNIVILKKKYADVISDIKMSKKCFGDKVRDIVKSGITDNIVYARKLLETK